MPIPPNLHMPLHSSSSFSDDMRSIAAMLHDPEPDFKIGLADQTKTPEYRFACLYGLLQILDRDYRYEEYKTLCSIYSNEFGGYPYYETFRALSARGPGTSLTDARKALRHSERAVRIIPNNAGVLHQYASIAADLLSQQTNPDQATLDLALKRLEDAFVLTARANPNFFYTRARLLRQRGEYDEALDSVTSALALQHADNSAGVRRIARSEALRATLQLDKKQLEISNSIKEATAGLKEARADQIQLLGVLAAVIALIVSGASIASRAEASDAIRILLTSTGAITVTFSCLLASYGTAKFGRVAISVIMGSIMIALGIVLKIGGGVV